MNPMKMNQYQSIKEYMDIYCGLMVYNTLRLKNNLM